MTDSIDKLIEDLESAIELGKRYQKMNHDPWKDGYMMAAEVVIYRLREMMKDE